MCASYYLPNKKAVKFKYIIFKVNIFNIDEC
jgi:hypothetical protein